MNNEWVYAPVIIPTLNRYEHFIRLIKSLERNVSANKTEIVVGLDFPPSHKYEEGYHKIKEYLKTFTGGFKKVTVLRATENLGVGANSARLIRYVKEQGYRYYIFSEDDNEFASNFIEYINWGLEKYENDDSLYAICSFKFLLPNAKEVNNNVYKSQSFNAWGYGIWLKKREEYDQKRDFTLMLKKVKSTPLSYAFCGSKWSKVRDASDMLGMIYHKKILGDTFVTIMLREYNHYCIFPMISKARNWGQDGSGLHGDSKEGQAYYSTIPLDTNEGFSLEREEIPVITYHKSICKYHRSFRFNVYTYVRFVLYKLTGIILHYKSY